MSISSFNLIDEPWIDVTQTDGHENTVSVRQLFQGAPTLRYLCGESPTQVFAITRVLLAIVRRAVAWGDDPMRTWSNLWEQGTFDIEEIDAYLDAVHHRFDLLDTAVPFMQVATLRNSKGESNPLSKIVATTGSTRDGRALFTMQTGAGLERISFAAAARWLINCHAFDVGGNKTGDPDDPRTSNGKTHDNRSPAGSSSWARTTGWAGRLGGIIFESRNLFETLMLNTVALDRDGEGPSPSDLPVWEREQLTSGVRATPTPSGPCDLLTWQTRRIRLFSDGDAVTGVLVTHGDTIIDPKNMVNLEPMTSWCEETDKRTRAHYYMPLRWSPDRAVWQGLESQLCDAQESRRALTADWIAMALTEELIRPGHPIRAHAYGLDYPDLHRTTVGASIDDSVQFAVSLFAADSEARGIASEAVRRTAAAVGALSDLAGALDRASGSRRSKPAYRAIRKRVKSEAYYQLSAEYRRWLPKLSESAGARKLDEWTSTVRELVTRMAEQLLAGTNPAALRGRMVGKRHFDAALAFELFHTRLRAALPEPARELSASPPIQTPEIGETKYE